MGKNIGSQEAYIRIAIGVAALLLALFIVESSTAKILLAVIAAVLAGTAFLRTCPVNKLMGRNSAENMQNDMASTPSKEMEMLSSSEPVAETTETIVPEAYTEE